MTTISADASGHDMTHYPDIERHRSVLLRRLQTAGTPIFLCERENLVARYDALRRSLQEHWGPYLIGYSFKTNYLVARCGVLPQLGAWAEVVSGSEYRLARELGFAGDHIVFNGPYKTEDDLKRAFADRALVNVNDHDELDRVLQMATASERGAAGSTRGEASWDVGLRISFTLPRLGHSRFGFSLENDEASAALEKIHQSSRVRLAALHTHLYGDTDDPELYAVAARRLGEFARRRIPSDQSPRFIDMGGGFPAHGPKPKSRKTWNPRPIDEYIHAITAELQPCFGDRQTLPTLIVEPGRYLTCDGIVLVLQVQHVKQREGKQHVNSNGSISMVPLTHYCPQILHVYTPELRRRTSETVASIVFGSTCRENDVLWDGLFPRTQPGDYLIYFAAGAYNSSLSPDFIFKSPGMELF